MIGPTFFSSFGSEFGSEPAPGSNEPSAAFVGPTGVGFTMALCRIDDGRMLLLYGNSADTTVIGVVLTVSGATITWGTPVNIAVGSSFTHVWSARQLNAATDEFVVCGRYNESSIYVRVIEISGSTITTPNALYTHTPGTSLFRGHMGVLSPTQLGLIYTPASGSISGLAATVAAGVVTFGTSAAMATTGYANLRSNDSPPAVTSGAMTIWFDMYDGVSLTNLNACKFSFSGTVTTIGTPWMQASPGDRFLRHPTTGFGTMAQRSLGSATMTMLYRDFGTGDIAETSGEFSSGVTGSYANSGSSPSFILGAPPNPYAPPPVDKLTGVSGAVNPAFSHYSVVYLVSQAVYLYTRSTAPAGQMSANIATLVASQAGNTIHEYVKSHKGVLVYRNSVTTTLTALVISGMN